MKHVSGYYIDAKDGTPETKAPLRHGPKLPSPNLTVDAVDRRLTPPLIIGRMPIGESIPESLTAITTEQHADLMADYQAWREMLESKQQQKAMLALADYRWRRETEGIIIGGVEIKTDRESQASLTSAYVSLSGGLITQTDWKAVDGWAKPDLAGITPIAKAVAEHVAKCFAAERAVSEMLEADSNINIAEQFDRIFLEPGEL